ncbi:hypothetical protein [Paenibacillus sacheonensis]|uniref:Uncharacterized protein n=1 Tax=Paenibacillus sacheonensis TaxID=742054 RepID=A0A7X4YQ87_9BACL|nr:hypothetical protein [Paenibacillus sacheonensis]MBM7566274.1 hypothetical protein [Paenibacillus sacheonensis]NBC70480.1 hypothetical protein [Paenibacillus sacheonensis]
MANKPLFTAKQELITDQDLELAMMNKEPIEAFQDRMRLRPISTIRSYNDHSVRIADGTIMFRSFSRFYTLSEQDKLAYSNK